MLRCLYRLLFDTVLLAKIVHTSLLNTSKAKHVAAIVVRFTDAGPLSFVLFYHADESPRSNPLNEKLHLPEIRVKGVRNQIAVVAIGIGMGQISPSS